MRACTKTKQISSASASVHALSTSLHPSRKIYFYSLLLLPHTGIDFHRDLPFHKLGRGKHCRRQAGVVFHADNTAAALNPDVGSVHKSCDASNMESFPRRSRARVRYNSIRLLSFRDACTEAPKQLENKDIEGLTNCVGPAGAKFYDKVTEDEKKRYGNRGFNFTQTQEIGPRELPPAIAKDPWGTQAKKETVCSTAKRILNKLTPENYEELVPELVQAGMTSTEDLVAVTSLIYDSAVMKPGLYAKLCVQLSKAMPEFTQPAGEKPVKFRRVLLNSCQEVFLGLDALREEIKNLTKAEQAVERDEKEKWAKLRTLGNIKLIGELFNERMLSEKIVHDCIQGLLGQDRNGTLVEENVEALCLLFTTVGKQLAESAKLKLAVDKYFAQLKVIGESTALPLRLRLMVRNVLDKLRVSGLEELKATKVSGFCPPRVSAGCVGARDLLQARRSELNVSPGARSPVAKPTTPTLTRKSVSLVKEYLDIVDRDEALLRVQELNNPRFHPEFVRLAITTALEMRERECSLLLKLLAHLQSEKVISRSDLREGVLRVPEGLEDMAIDAPLAPKLLGGLLAELVLAGAVELQLVQEAIWKLDDDYLQQDVLKAVVAKWKLEESEVQLDEVCRKASVDMEALLSVVVASDLANMMPFLECGAAAMPEFMARDHLDMRTNKDDFNQRSHLSRLQMFGNLMVDSVGGTRQGADDQARLRSLSVRAGSDSPRRGYDSMYVSQLSLGTRSPVAKPTTPPEPADLTRKSVSLVKEYLDIEDLNEALLCVQELDSPRFHPEFVRLAITTAMDMREKECSLLLKLLAHLQSEKVISRSDLREGVLRVPEGLEDMAIDAPLAPKLLGEMLGGLVLSGAVELTLVQASLWKLEDEFLQQDVLKAVVAKWKLQENQGQLVDVCRKASVDKEALLSVAVPSDLVKVMEIGAGRAAAMPELMLHGNFDMRSNKDDFNLRSLLQRLQMYGK